MSNMFIVAALQLGTGFVTDFKSFLYVRRQLIIRYPSLHLL